MSFTPPLPAGARSHDSADGLPLGKLLALALAGFITIMTETVPAGLLDVYKRQAPTSPATGSACAAGSTPPTGSATTAKTACIYCGRCAAWAMCRR